MRHLNNSKGWFWWSVFSVPYLLLTGVVELIIDGPLGFHPVLAIVSFAGVVLYIHEIATSAAYKNKGDVDVSGK